MTHLDIQHNPIKCRYGITRTDEGEETIDTLSKLTNLSFLSFSSCGIRGDDIENITKLTNLITLDVSLNFFMNNTALIKLLDMRSLVGISCYNFMYVCVNIGAEEREKLKSLIFFRPTDDHMIADDDELETRGPYTDASTSFDHEKFLCRFFLERVFTI